jgi:hypothetical protein
MSYKEKQDTFRTLQKFLTQVTERLWGRNINSMERLDQDHLHPKREVPRQTCPDWESNPVLRGGR